jgi:hypothetical protein
MTGSTPPCWLQNPNTCGTSWDHLLALSVMILSFLAAVGFFAWWRLHEGSLSGPQRGFVGGLAALGVVCGWYLVATWWT